MGDYGGLVGIVVMIVFAVVVAVGVTWALRRKPPDDRRHDR